jgi:hypothetical protein
MYKNKFDFLRNVVAIAICLAGMTFFFSCEKDMAELGGKQSPIGNTGTTFRVINSVPGASNFSARVVSLEDGVSSVSKTVNITNAKFLSMISALSDVNISGTSVTRNPKYRFTDAGIQSVYPEGNLNLVKYNAKVGDVYTLKRGAHTIRREVTEVSKKDEFQWNNMLIKTTHVKETGRGIPGLNKIEFVTNHKFGVVALKFELEDGSTVYVPLSSSVTN